MGIAEGEQIQADASTENEPGFLFDALVVPDGDGAVQALLGDAHALDFVRDIYRHCKPLLVLGQGVQLLQRAGVPLATKDSALLFAEDVAGLEAAAGAFLAAVGAPRHFERETDPPQV